VAQRVRAHPRASRDLTGAVSGRGPCFTHGWTV
jgi:hypothetical protein